MRKGLKRFISIIGTLLITTILISGSGVAPPTHWALDIYTYYNCTNEEEALNASDGVHATLGINSPPALGKIMLDLGEGNEMGHEQEFYVYASSNIRENYSLSLHSHNWSKQSEWYENNDDTTTVQLTTPEEQGWLWRYIEIESEEGQTGDNDLVYGSEIDAFGW